MHNILSPTLVSELNDKLQGKRATYQPYVIENIIRQTKTLHVTVIWDKWANLDAQSRSEVILDTYQASGRMTGLTITIALGVTVAEAIRLGLVPYAVVPTVRKTDKIDPAEVRKALRELKVGFPVEGERSTQVRFRTEAEAEDAFRMLMEKFGSKPYWAISQEVAAIPNLENQ